MNDCEMHEVQCGLIADLVESLLAEATVPGLERRLHPRVTFFGPVTVVRSANGQSSEVSCFSRDISMGGIGLLHSAALELGPAAVCIPRREGGQIELPCEIVWCRPCGEGWYVAGGRFITHESPVE
jgi:hypothetical protein